ncbi:MAG: REP-associated tyrosine transposase [Luteibaculum sp.]
MSASYKIEDQEALHFLTLQVVNWADIFTRIECRDIILDSFEFCSENKGLEIYGYVIMSNHIHLLVKSSTGNLSETLRDLKRHTSKQILEFVHSQKESRRDWLLMIFKYAARKNNRTNQYQVWTHENHAEIIYSTKFIEQKLDYIHNNPVSAGIVQYPEDYLYSSARCYAGIPALFETHRLKIPWKTVR